MPAGAAYKAAHDYLGALPLTTGTGVVTSSRRQIEIAFEWGTNVWYVRPEYSTQLAKVARDELKVGPARAQDQVPRLRARPRRRQRVPQPDRGAVGLPGLRHVRHPRDGHGLVRVPGARTACISWRTARSSRSSTSRPTKPVPDGTIGNMVCTILHRRLPPMIRFNLRDLTRIVAHRPLRLRQLLPPHAEDARTQRHHGAHPRREHLAAGLPAGDQERSAHHRRVAVHRRAQRARRRGARRDDRAGRGAQRRARLGRPAGDTSRSGCIPTSALSARRRAGAGGRADGMVEPRARRQAQGASSISASRRNDAGPCVFRLPFAFLHPGGPASPRPRRNTRTRSACSSASARSRPRSRWRTTFRSRNVRTILDIYRTWRMTDPDEIRASNDYAADFARNNPDIVYGNWLAINPTMKDFWIAEFKRLADGKSRLLRLLPEPEQPRLSAQRSGLGPVLQAVDRGERAGAADGRADRHRPGHAGRHGRRARRWPPPPCRPGGGALSGAEDPRRPPGLAVAGRHDRGAAAQGATSSTSCTAGRRNISRRRSRRRSAAACRTASCSAGTGRRSTLERLIDDWRGLGYSGRGLREDLPPQRRGVFPRRGAEIMD